MQSRSWLFLAAGVLAGGCAPPADEQAEAASVPPATEFATSADVAAIDALRSEYVRHYNLRHPEAVAELHADSATAAYADGLIAHGRAAILADLQADASMNGMLDLASDEVMVFGEHAVSRGRWRVTPGEGSTMPGELSGHFMTYFTKATGTWQIGFVVTNYDSPPPEGMPAPPDGTPPPPGEGMMKELAAEYTRAYNAGDAAAVAALYTEDAFRSTGNQTPVTGRAAIQARLEEQFAAGRSTIEIHDVSTVDLGDGWALDGGWLDLTPAVAGAGPDRGGVYVILVRQQPDGSRKLHWSLSNLNPVN